MTGHRAQPALVGRRYTHGRYEVTFLMDADDCDSIGSDYEAKGDAWADELFATADEIRRREAARDEAPGLWIAVGRTVS